MVLLVNSKLLRFFSVFSVWFVLCLFCIRFSMFGGKLVCCYKCIIVLLFYGVSLLGLKIMVLFVSNVGMICLFGKWLGKLYGLNIVSMLCGWCCRFVVLFGILLCCLLVWMWYVLIDIVILLIIVVILVVVF